MSNTFSIGLPPVIETGIVSINFFIGERIEDISPVDILRMLIQHKYIEPPLPMEDSYKVSITIRTSNGILFLDEQHLVVLLERCLAYVMQPSEETRRSLFDAWEKQRNNMRIVLFTDTEYDSRSFIRVQAS